MNEENQGHMSEYSVSDEYSEKKTEYRASEDYSGNTSDDLSRAGQTEESPEEVHPEQTQENHPEEVQSEQTQEDHPENVQPEQTREDHPENVQPEQTQENCPGRVQSGLSQDYYPENARREYSAQPIVNESRVGSDGKKRKKNFWDGVLVGILGMMALLALVVFGSAAYSYVMGYSYGSSASSGSSEGAIRADISENVEDKLSEIQAYVDKYFIFDVDDESMEAYTAKGYMAGLNDPYSVYYTKEEYEEEMEDSDGNFVGIGATVQQDTETKAITVLNVYKDSPAEKGGMLAGDVIIGVNGEDTSAMEMSDVVDLIRGEAGTEVIVRVRRDDEEIDLTMTRAAIAKETVTYEMMDDSIGYIKLTEFDTVSIDQMKAAIEDLQSKGMKSLVLDLRDNPGGLLTSVVSITGYFLSDTNIFYFQDKEGNRTDYDSSAEQLCTEPMAILVNGNSASASEVLSGSLQDHERATIVGTQSFGKGIVQSFFTLSDGSAIKLTTAHYYTPNGNDIHGVGITPDVVVENDEETDIDEQLQAAIDALTK